MYKKEWQFITRSPIKLAVLLLLLIYTIYIPLSARIERIPYERTEGFQEEVEKLEGPFSKKLVSQFGGAGEESIPWKDFKGDGIEYLHDQYRRSFRSVYYMHQEIEIEDLVLSGHFKMIKLSPEEQKILEEEQAKYKAMGDPDFAYISSWKDLFDLLGRHNPWHLLWFGCLTILFADTFSREKESRMRPLIATTRYGRRLSSRKIIFNLGITFLLTTFIFLLLFLILFTGNGQLQKASVSARSYVAQIRYFYTLAGLAWRYYLAWLFLSWTQVMLTMAVSSVMPYSVLSLAFTLLVTIIIPYRGEMQNLASGDAYIWTQYFPWGDSGLLGLFESTEIGYGARTFLDATSITKVEWWVLKFVIEILLALLLIYLRDIRSWRKRHEHS